MFENLNNNGQMPANMAPDQEPARRAPAEDIFAATDATGKPPIFQPKNYEPQPEAGQIEMVENDWRRYLVLGGIFLGILILGGGIYWGVSKLSLLNRIVIDNTPADNSAQVSDNKAAVATGTEPATQPAQNQAVNTAVQQIDSDQDGLSDAEEKTLGTDQNKVDTDSDGLFDREEVQIYKTDPLKPDTDGDGILDGDEVKQGLDPKGTGKLFDLNSQTNGAKDSDQDGLTDDEEKNLATDPAKADTDADGLTDYQEVKVYKTNPLKPDTDGDGFKDGDEVKSGYNPNGPGKLAV